MSQPLSSTEISNHVKRVDRERFAITMLCRAEDRPKLHALLALYHELGHIRSQTADPMPALIRLTWWKEALLAMPDESKNTHPLLDTLAGLGLLPLAQPSRWESILTAYGEAIQSPHFLETSEQQQSYARATSGQLTCLLADVTENDPSHSWFLAAGEAYGIARTLKQQAKNTATQQTVTAEATNLWKNRPSPMPEQAKPWQMLCWLAMDQLKHPKRKESPWQLARFLWVAARNQ